MRGAREIERDGCDKCERVGWERERGVKVGRGRIGQEKGKSWEK